MTFFSRSPAPSPLLGQGDETDVDVSEALDPPPNAASTMYPKCAACQGLIQNIIVQALDKTWHPEHFRCTHCRIPIATQKFHVHAGSPYCVEDYASLFLNKCQGCRLPIKDVVVTALNQTWHPDHFVCISCGTKLLYKGFYEREGNAFCTACYEGKFCPKCFGCGKPITETAIKVHDRKWHEACFRCGRCRRPISGPTFRVCEADVVCVECSEKGREEGKNDTSSYFEEDEEED
ncbi:leupaxin-like [Diaphorina citri]|uniref:Leupaxin-like n=1 Tax=Diaphorina citri TaxID=121845 RepID=A0A1S3D7R0_DIACI|nr:leupaxin-like [Diaphorina citri]KAI5717624.1 hypothetical protein M8J77_008737 [Diaphorina citri]